MQPQKQKKRKLYGFIAVLACFALISGTTVNTAPVKNAVNAAIHSVSSIFAADNRTAGAVLPGPAQGTDPMLDSTNSADGAAENTSEKPEGAEEDTEIANPESMKPEEAVPETETEEGPEPQIAAALESQEEANPGDAGNDNATEVEEDIVEDVVEDIVEEVVESEIEEDPEEQWRKTFYPVPSSPAVDEFYFRDALFIGDSRVMGLMLYSGLTGEATFYTEKGVNVTTLLTKAIVLETGGNRITIPEALNDRQFGKIYIKTGINELGWRSLKSFIEAYGEVIDRIRELQPEAVLYIQSILPVSQKKAEEGSYFTIPRILEFNEEIKKLTWEKGVYYLDVFQGMVNEEGFLPEEAGNDGVHLNKEYCKIWLEYLKRHVVRDYGY